MFGKVPSYFAIVPSSALRSGSRLSFSSQFFTAAAVFKDEMTVVVALTEFSSPRTSHVAVAGSAKVTGS